MKTQEEIIQKLQEEELKFRIVQRNYKRSATARMDAEECRRLKAETNFREAEVNMLRWVLGMPEIEY